MSGLNFHFLNPRDSVTATGVREVTPQDLASLDAVKGSTAPTLSRIRDSHHALARIVALGHTNIEAAAITGYTPGRVSVLRSDPAFQDLVAHYKSRADEQFADLGGRMKAISLDVLSELHERIIEHPEEFSPKDLTDAFKTVADRIGYGPASKTESNVSVRFSLAAVVEEALRLEKADENST
jgi:hypothetical protein